MYLRKNKHKNNKTMKNLFRSIIDTLFKRKSKQNDISSYIHKVEDSKKESDLSYMARQKQLHSNAYTPWTTDEDERLQTYISNGVSIKEIALRMGRSRGAIRSRMKKLGFIF